MTRYFILFCLAGIIELIFMGLGSGTSAFSLLAALSIILFSRIILGKKFVNGRIIRLALGFSALHIILGNIPIAVASQAERHKTVSAVFSDGFWSFLGTIFQGPLDHYIYFWIAQSFIFTLVFLAVFVIFSKLLRRTDNAIPAGTVPNQNS
ncbi:MAG: hypothetical protein GY839_14500 [candidate division Zixibacteria bacterium]|nr:hypothetical protein [candidate division Zixibacteria bacterium]